MLCMVKLSRIDDLIYFIADCGKGDYAKTVNDGWRECNDNKFDKLDYLMKVYEAAKTASWLKHQRYSAKVTFVSIFRNFMNILDPRSKEFEYINKEYFKAINVQKTTITQTNGILNNPKLRRT